ncbi:MAG: 2-C-methyl-D-erythritol 4-phosphate cytidylyltransferase, partial [Gammaproteobacteria bacterium]|nr:2-C-methyl-D-erythritol 4-phosphate cytidylyltransferase [Gammaproteobacteria bacterium]
RGRRSNIKLTYPEDLELIEALLSVRGEAQL